MKLRKRCGPQGYTLFSLPYLIMKKDSYVCDHVYFVFVIASEFLEQNRKKFLRKSLPRIHQNLRNSGKFGFFPTPISSANIRRTLIFVAAVAIQLKLNQCPGSRHRVLFDYLQLKQNGENKFLILNLLESTFLYIISKVLNDCTENHNLISMIFFLGPAFHCICYGQALTVADYPHGLNLFL